MRRIKYKGDGENLGRHGAVKKGDVLFLTEHEAFTVENNKEFTKLREIPLSTLPEDHDIPPHGNYADLRDISWGSERAFKQVNKLHRTRLMSMIRQLEASGYSVPPIKKLVNIMARREFILETARHAKW